MDAYLNYQDAMMRLNDTICLYEGEPVYVVMSGNDQTEAVIRFYDGTSRRSKVINYTDDKFTYHPIRLGYMNIGKNTFYLTRSPVRRQKQGLSQDNIVNQSNTRISSRWFPSKGLTHCIQGKYPSLKDALKLLNDRKTKGVAVDRDIALKLADTSTITIYFKERTVGLFDLQKRSVSWSENEMTSIIFRILERKGLGSLITGGF